jgi:Secretion system C-terminal sorting domain
MKRVHRILFPFYFIFFMFFQVGKAGAQELPPRYATQELFTNTPCPICGSQNPGLFSRLENYEGQYHLVSFYPGKPYTSCIFYQANIPENTARWQFYTGEVFGTPTVAINGIDFKTSNGVTTAVLNDITGNTTWLKIKVDETTGTSRNVDITLQDHVGGSLTSGLLFAVIVEKEIQYNAPNGETLHHNVFRKFLTAPGGDLVDLSSGTAMASYVYELDQDWAGDQTYVIAWLMDPVTKEIYNSGTRFDPDFVSAVGDIADAEMLHLYPNPTTGLFKVTLPESQHTVSVNVFNAAGALVFTQDYVAVSEISLDGSVWPEGIYAVRVMMGGKEVSEWVRVVR